MKFKWNLTKSIFALSLIALLPASAQANLITNGDFATDLSNWTPSSACVTVSHVGSGNPGGSALLNHCGESTNNPGVTQTVAGLTIGAAYDLGWENSLHVDWSGTSRNGLSFGVFIDSVIVDLSENLTTNWVAGSLSFLATNTSHSFTFAGELDARTPGVSGTTDVSYYLDNVSLTQVAVPEPSIIALFAAGLLGIGFARRRKA